MLSIDEILAKAELITLETQIDSITPMRVGELFTSLAEQLRLGVGAGATIGASKLSELADVMLLNNKDNDILQKIGTKWTNIQLDLNKINQISSFWKLDANGNLYTDLNVYSTQGVSAYGAGPDGEGGATGYDRLDAWSLYTNDKSGWVLSALLGKELHDRVLVLEAGGGGGIGTEIDPTVAAHIKNITTGDLTNWATAYAKSHEHDNISILNATTASFLTADRNKLDGIAAGAQVNVQANWDVASGPAAILNKPYALPASDVYAWAKEATKPSYNFSDIASKPTTLSGYGITDGLSISIYTAHKSNQNAEKHVTADDLNVLSHLSIVNGALQVDVDFYSTGGISAYGYGESGGGGGSMVVWGIESAGAVPLTVEGVTKTLSLASHTHSGYLTGNQTITVSGDATGSGTTSIALTLANSGVVAGTYNNSATQVRPFTVDSKGRITNIGTAVTITPAWGSITGTPTTLAGYGITGLTTNYLTKWNGTTIVNSSIFDNGTNVKIGGVFATPNSKLQITGGWLDVDRDYGFRFSVGDQVRGSIRSNSSNEIRFSTGSVVDAIVLADSGFVGISTTTPTATLDVNGIGKFKDDILMTFNTWSYNNWTYPTDKNSMKKFLNLFDIDTAGNLVVKTNLYSTGEVTAYSTGTGVSGLKLQGDMNANGKRIYNVSAVESVSALFGNDPLGLIDGVSPGLFDKNNETIIAAYSLNTSKYIYGNGWMTINNFGLMTAPKMESGEFKFGSWTFKQDGSGRLGIYNGTSEVACFNTDGTYVNL